MQEPREIMDTDDSKSVHRSARPPVDGIPRQTLIGIIIYCCLCYAVWLADRPLLMKLATEDGLLETVGAIYFLVNAILLLILFTRSDHSPLAGDCRSVRNTWFLVLALVYVFCFGEEINWGQRIFNMGTPLLFEQWNVQDVLNVHNLIFFNPLDFEGNKKPLWQQLFTLNMAFAYFAFTMYLLIPLFNRYRPTGSEMLRRHRLLISPISIGVLIAVTFLVDKITKLFLNDVALWYPNEEIREHIWSFLFLVVTVYLLGIAKSASSHARRICQPTD